MRKETRNGLVGLVLIFIFFVLFRVYYQKGAKLLANLYPWNYIALAAIVLFLLISDNTHGKAQKR